MRLIRTWAFCAAFSFTPRCAYVTGATWALERADLLARIEAGENACDPFEMLALSCAEDIQSTTAQKDVAAGPGEAVRAGVATDRLVFGGRLPAKENSGWYTSADLFPDTLAFNAGTTANDAFFAGLPVLTRPGHWFSARMASSLLRTLDLPRYIRLLEAAYREMLRRWQEGLAPDHIRVPCAAGLRD